MINRNIYIWNKYPVSEKEEIKCKQYNKTIQK